MAGLDFEFNRELSDAEELAHVKAGEVDLVWACGLLTAELIAAGHELEVVAAPIFPGEHVPVYRSVVIARDDAPYAMLSDGLTGRLAVNEHASWSGWHGFAAYLDSLGLGDHFFSSVAGRPPVVSGSHEASIDAVLAGHADLAAIDSSLWDALAAEGRVGGLKALVSTTDWPAPPFSVRATLSGTARRQVVSVLLENPAIAPAKIDDYEFMRERAAMVNERVWRERRRTGAD